MSQLAEAIETYTYVITGLSEHTQISYRDKLKVFEQFCSERNINLADIMLSPLQTSISLIMVLSNQRRLPQQL
jgi:site-specific recombinase XerD